MTQSSYGSFLKPSGGVEFRVWAPDASSLEVVLYKNENEISSKIAATKDNESGVWHADFPLGQADTLYKYEIDGKGPFPDPASRYQPLGVHGPSAVVDQSFQWGDSSWSGIAERDRLIVYELHVGTFSTSGTYQGVIEHLDHLHSLGVNTIELLPLADFPGKYNWGYDGVSLYAPARCYGSPQELKALVNAAHQRGIAVVLDVVYNHFGPDGNYLSCFSSHYFTKAHETPWGPALNIDRHGVAAKDLAHVNHVRRFLIENALYWLREFHFDGLRLDATHALVDNSSPHFLQDLSVACHGVGKRVVLWAEDDRNDSALISQPPTGLGIDVAWADDFHHEIRVHCAGDDEAYFAEFTGTAEDISKTINQGWFYTGQEQRVGKKKRGTPTDKISNLSSFCFCIQNHDQVGNRAMGERLNHDVDANTYKAASAVLLLSPEMPLLFEGQEWACSSPFCFFTDHKPDLGKLITAGRRREFAHFRKFSQEEFRDRIPDPQAPETFSKSKLRWEEISSPAHAATLAWYRALISLRLSHSAMRSAERQHTLAFPIESNIVGILRYEKAQSVSGAVLAVVCLKKKQKNGDASAEQRVDLQSVIHAKAKSTGALQFKVLLSSDEQRFGGEPNAVKVDGGKITFANAGAVVVQISTTDQPSQTSA